MAGRFGFTGVSRKPLNENRKPRELNVFVVLKVITLDKCSKKQFRMIRCARAGLGSVVIPASIIISVAWLADVQRINPRGRTPATWTNDRHHLTRCDSPRHEPNRPSQIQRWIDLRTRNAFMLMKDPAPGVDLSHAGQQIEIRTCHRSPLRSRRHGRVFAPRTGRGSSQQASRNHPAPNR